MLRYVSLLANLGVKVLIYFFFFQAEDGIRDLVRSRGLGDVYKRQTFGHHLIDPLAAILDTTPEGTIMSRLSVLRDMFLSLIHI